jgi:hypothetical protein
MTCEEKKLLIDLAHANRIAEDTVLAYASAVKKVATGGNAKDMTEEEKNAAGVMRVFSDLAQDIYKIVVPEEA